MTFSSDKTVSQMMTMLKYQQALNDVFDPKWRENRHQYLRAAVVEASEAIAHHGYKWWKKEEKDVQQLQLEVVDILHFYLSEVARVNLDNPEYAVKKAWLEDNPEINFDGKLYNVGSMALLDKIELIIGLAVSRRMSWTLFRSIMEGVDLSFSALHKMYAAKNVLNLLRQRHGDKEGTYIKIWDGEEDNVHLSKELEKWGEDETMDVLYERLESSYKSIALGTI